jgi:hypothetical protein
MLIEEMYRELIYGSETSLASGPANFATRHESKKSRGQHTLVAMTESLSHTIALNGCDILMGEQPGDP